jgi:hypothetical protein
MKHLALALLVIVGLAATFAAAQERPGEPDAAAKPAPSTDNNTDKQADETPKLLPDGSLPWKRREAEIQPEQIAASARDMLAGFGIDKDDFALFDDGRPFSTEELNVLLRVIYRLPNMTPDDLARWAPQKVDWAELDGDPGEHRGDVYHLHGRAREIVKMELPQEQAEIFDLPHLWRVAVEMDGAPGALEIIARDIPQAWLKTQHVDQPFEAYALFIKRAAPNDAQQADGNPGPLTFVAGRLGWYPDRPDKELGVEPVHVYLSQLGVDLSEFDALVDRNKKLPPEPFYQLLAAVGKTDRAAMEKYSEPFSLVDLLQNPQSQRGRIIDLTGHAQQVTKILVDDPDVRERFGIDHYYEIDMFVQLPGQGARIVDPRDETKTLDYQQYPVTVCVRELPEGLTEPGKAGVYETVNRDVTLPAVFFKVWAVSTARVRQLGPDQMQFNPLLIGAEPQVLKYDQLAGPWLGYIVAAVFGVALIAVWLGVWRSQKGDQKFDQQTIRKQFEVQQGESLDEMGIQASDGPDFSGLEAMDNSPSPKEE